MERPNDIRTTEQYVDALQKVTSAHAAMCRLIQGLVNNGQLPGYMATHYWERLVEVSNDLANDIQREYLNNVK